MRRIYENAIYGMVVLVGCGTPKGDVNAVESRLHTSHIQRQSIERIGAPKRQEPCTIEGIVIEGAPEFQNHMEEVIEFLKKHPEEWNFAATHITKVKQGEFAKYFPNTGIMWVGSSFDPIYCHDEDKGDKYRGHWLQLANNAATIIHDAEHSRRFLAGLKYSEEEGEMACNSVQAEFYLKLGLDEEIVNEWLNIQRERKSWLWSDEKRAW